MVRSAVKLCVTNSVAVPTNVWLHTSADEDIWRQYQRRQRRCYQRSQTRHTVTLLNCCCVWGTTRQHPHCRTLRPSWCSSQCLTLLLRPLISTPCLHRQRTPHQHLSVTTSRPAPVGYAARAPVLEYIAPASSYVTPAPVDEYFTPALAVNAAPTTVVGFIPPAPVVVYLAPAGNAAPAPVDECIAPAPATHAVYAASAPVVCR